MLSITFDILQWNMTLKSRCGSDYICINLLEHCEILDVIFLKAEEKHKEILGHLLYTVKIIACQEGLEDGYRVVINDGPNGCKFIHLFYVLNYF